MTDAWDTAPPRGSGPRNLTVTRIGGVWTPVVDGRAVFMPGVTVRKPSKLRERLAPIAPFFNATTRRAAVRSELRTTAVALVRGARRAVPTAVVLIALGYTARYWFLKDAINVTPTVVRHAARSFVIGYSFRSGVQRVRGSRQFDKMLVEQVHRHEAGAEFPEFLPRPATRADRIGTYLLVPVLVPVFAAGTVAALFLGIHLPGLGAAWRLVPAKLAGHWAQWGLGSGSKRGLARALKPLRMERARKRVDVEMSHRSIAAALSDRRGIGS